MKLLDACITSIDFGQQLMKVLVVSIHSHIMRMDGGGTGLGSFIGDFTGDAMMPAFHQFGDGGVVFDVLVQFGHQRALAIPLMWTDNVYALGLEGISGADHGTDVKIVGPVFHRNFEVVTPSSVKIGLNGSNGPVAVTVQYVAAVSVVQQHRVETTVIIRRSRIIGTRLTGMGLRPRPKADFTEFRFT